MRAGDPPRGCSRCPPLLRGRPDFLSSGDRSCSPVPGSPRPQWRCRRSARCGTGGSDRCRSPPSPCASGPPPCPRPPGGPERSRPLRCLRNSIVRARMPDRGFAYPDGIRGWVEDGPGACSRALSLRWVPVVSRHPRLRLPPPPPLHLPGPFPPVSRPPLLRSPPRYQYLVQPRSRNHAAPR